MKEFITKRVRLGVGVVIAVGLLLTTAATAVGAPPRFFQDMRGATWTAHLTGADTSLQGEAWLKKTPCGLGSFLQLKAPSVAGQATEERLVLREEGSPDVLLASVGSDLPDFGIVLAYWPTGTPLFPDDPSPMFVQLEVNKPFGAALPYQGAASLALPLQPADFFSALDSGHVWVDVVVGDDVVLSGRVAH